MHKKDIIKGSSALLSLHKQANKIGLIDDGINSLSKFFKGKPKGLPGPKDVDVLDALPGQGPIGRTPANTPDSIRAKAVDAEVVQPQAAVDNVAPAAQATPDVATSNAAGRSSGAAFKDKLTRHMFRNRGTYGYLAGSGLGLHGMYNATGKVRNEMETAQNAQLEQIMQAVQRQKQMQEQQIGDLNSSWANRGIIDRVLNRPPGQ